MYSQRLQTTEIPQLGKKGEILQLNATGVYMRAISRD